MMLITGDLIRTVKGVDATGSMIPQEVVTLNPDYWFSYVTMLVIHQCLCAVNNLQMHSMLCSMYVPWRLLLI